MSKGTNISQADFEAMGFYEAEDGTFKRKPVVKPIAPNEPKTPLGRVPAKVKHPKAEKSIMPYVDATTQKKIEYAPQLIIKKVMEEISKEQAIKIVKETGMFLFKANEQKIQICSFDIVPYPAPRMVRSDKWKTDPNHIDPKKRQRICVQRYFAYRAELQRQAKEKCYMLSETLNITFYMPMPESWSKKKQERMHLTPHQSRPDIDNLVKGFLDSLAIQDGFVWDIHAKKYWSLEPGIRVFV